MFNKLLDLMIHAIFYTIELTIKVLKWLIGAIIFLHVYPVEIFLKRIPKGKRLLIAFHLGIISFALILFLHPVLAIEDYSTSLTDYPYEFDFSAPEPAEWTVFNLDKFADAVAEQETGYCTDPNSPTANARNNCWGIMTWPGGVRTLKTYSSIAEGKADFMRLWHDKYDNKLPTLKMAETYSGRDQSFAWWTNTRKFYFESII